MSALASVTLPAGMQIPSLKFQGQEGVNVIKEGMEEEGRKGKEIYAHSIVRFECFFCQVGREILGLCCYSFPDEVI